jgi:hypothetical protein
MELHTRLTQNRAYDKEMLFLVCCFNTALEKAVTEINLDIGGTILHISIQILVYANYVAIAGRYENAVKDSFNKPEMEDQNMGLMINYDKTKYMGIGKPAKEK